MIFTPTRLQSWPNTVAVKVKTGQGDSYYTKWIPARPLRYAGFFYRVKIAWLVFKGRYDALDWEDS